MTKVSFWNQPGLNCWNRPSCGKRNWKVFPLNMDLHLAKCSQTKKMRCRVWQLNLSFLNQHLDYSTLTSKKVDWTILHSLLTYSNSAMYEWVMHFGMCATVREGILQFALFMKPNLDVYECRRTLWCEDKHNTPGPTGQATAFFSFLYLCGVETSVDAENLEVKLGFFDSVVFTFSNAVIRLWCASLSWMGRSFTQIDCFRITQVWQKKKKSRHWRTVK